MAKTETTLNRVHDCIVIVAAVTVFGYMAWTLITTLSWRELCYAGTSLMIITGLSIFIVTRPSTYWLFHVRRRNG